MTQDNKLEYPVWVCADCGIKEARISKEGAATFHMDVCQVCGKHTYVTEPRDYGYPEFSNRSGYVEFTKSRQIVDLVRKSVYAWSCPNCSQDNITDNDHRVSAIVSCSNCREYFRVDEIYEELE